MRRHVAESGRGEVYKFTRPEMKFRYHPMLAYEAYVEWESRGFVGHPLSPEDIAQVDYEWRRDLNKISDLFSFHRRPDSGHRASRPSRS